MLGPELSVEWDKATDIAFIPQDIADGLINAGWAKELTDNFAEDLNAKMAKLEAQIEKAFPEPTPEKPVEPIAEVVEKKTLTAPVKGDTPAPNKSGGK
jgi:hypothetical protein